MAEFQYSSGRIALHYIALTSSTSFIMRFPLRNQATG